jgi:hypothetical protein
MWSQNYSRRNIILQDFHLVVDYKKNKCGLLFLELCSLLVADAVWTKNAVYIFNLEGRLILNVDRVRISKEMIVT